MIVLQSGPRGEISTLLRLGVWKSMDRNNIFHNMVGKLYAISLLVTVYVFCSPSRITFCLLVAACSIIIVRNGFYNVKNSDSHTVVGTALGVSSELRHNDGSECSMDR